MTPHNHHHSYHHGNHLCHQALSNPSCCSSFCCSCNCNSSSCSPHPHPPPPPPPPPPISTDQLLQSMATNLLKTQSFLKPEQIHSQSLLQDLIRRVSALESSLSQLSSHSPPISTAPPSPTCLRRTSPPSLRDVAARTIQARFRRFLVRQSQTLRDLKRLASIKSSAAALRTSISSDADAEPDALSQKAMELLLQLDSIQSSDPMIRDGKRSISRELTRMLEFVDKVLARERPVSLQAMEVMEDAAASLPRARSAKRVSFANNSGRIVEEAREGFSRVLEKEEVLGNRNGAFFLGKNGGFGLSAPLPLQMEPRFDVDL